MDRRAASHSSGRAGHLRWQPNLLLYLALGLALIAARPWLVGVQLFPGAAANAVYESQSATLLTLVGAVSAIRWLATRERSYLLLGLAIIPSSALHWVGYQIDVTGAGSAAFGGNRDAIGLWINNVNSLVLSSMLCLPTLRRWREGQPAVLALIATGLTLGLLALTPIVVSTASTVVNDAADGLAIVLFAGALVHVVRQGEWRSEPVFRGLLSAIVVLLISQAAYEHFEPAHEGNFVTATDLFQLGAAAFLAIAGIVELRRTFLQAVLSAKLLGAPNGDLLDAVVDLKEADDAKTRFLAMISHELRTPLNGILGYAQLLTAEIGGGLAEGQRRYVDRIEESGDDLLELVDGLLDVAAVNAGTSNLPASEVMLTEAVAAAWADIARPAERRQIRCAIHVPAGLVVCGSSTVLVRVIRNLLANAVKFSHAGGQVSVLAVRSAGLVEITVADDGIGIPEDQLERIFERFTQVSEGTQRRFSGAGLGLTVARQLLAGMDGRIVARNRQPVGSEFLITLPAACSEGPPPAIKAAVGASA